MLLHQQNSLLYRRPHVLKINHNICRFNIKARFNNKNKEIFPDTLKWFGWSIVYNIYNKEALINIQNPYVVTAIQTTAALLGSLKLLNSHNKHDIINLFIRERTFLFACIIMSTGQWFGNYFANLASQEMSYATVNIIKSSEPIISMIIMYSLFRQSLNIIKNLLIIPIIIGIILCTQNDITYSHEGAFLCILSNISHVIKTITTKKYFSEKYYLDGNTLFGISMFGSFIICLPIMIQQLEYLKKINIDGWFYLFMSSISYYFNSVAAFDVMAKVFPVSFSVLNIYKRVIIILSYYVLNAKIPTLEILIGMLTSNISLFYYLN